MKLSISLFDARKFEDLRDSNEYLRKVTSFANGMWYIDTDNTTEVERLLKKDRIRYSIKS